jgi:ATP-binding cassette subfamily B protein
MLPLSEYERQREEAEPAGTLRRVVRLFAPHRFALSCVAIMVLIETVVSISWPFLLRAVLDTAIPQKRTRLLLILTVGMIAVAVVANGLMVVQAAITSRVGQQIMHGLRCEVFAHLQALPLRFFTDSRAGEIQSRLFNDIGGMQTTLTTAATSFASNGATVVATLAAMLSLNWSLTLFVIPLVAIFVWLSRQVGDERKAITGKRQKALSSIMGLAGEALSIGGVMLARTTGQEPTVFQRFRNASSRVTDIEVKAAMSGRWRMSINGIVLACVPPVLYLSAGTLIGVGKSSITVGTLVAFVALQQALVWPLNEILTRGISVQSSLMLFQRTFEYLDLPVEAHEGTASMAAEAVRGEVCFEGVSFSYGADFDRKVLRDISLTIPAGSHVAIVGASGSGKTTLGHLLTRLHDATVGRITIDGVDVRNLLRPGLAEIVAVVNQDPFFFNESIRENLHFAKPDAPIEELIDAAHTAHIHDAIAELPDGFDTMLGERGYRMSGGEKQRLAIARAVLRKPRVLILDEATSALDGNTEERVLDSVRDLDEACTIISIAHRLTVAHRADVIIVLENGAIVESGSHDELIAAGGMYAEMVARTITDSSDANLTAA